MTRPGLLDLDPGSQGKPRNSWCVSFETKCISVIQPRIWDIFKANVSIKCTFWCRSIHPTKSQENYITHSGRQYLNQCMPLGHISQGFTIKCLYEKCPKSFSISLLVKKFNEMAFSMFSCSQGIHDKVIDMGQLKWTIIVTLVIIIVILQ